MKKVLFAIVLAAIVAGCNMHKTNRYKEGDKEKATAVENADTILAHLIGWEVVYRNVTEMLDDFHEDKDGNRNEFYHWVVTVKVSDGMDTLTIRTSSSQYLLDGFGWKGSLTGAILGPIGGSVEQIRRQNLAMRRACDGDSCFRMLESNNVLSADFEKAKPKEPEIPREAYGLE